MIRADARANAVFACRGADGAESGAELAGTGRDRKFRGMAAGSRKAAGSFWLPAGAVPPPAVMLVPTAPGGPAAPPPTSRPGSRSGSRSASSADTTPTGPETSAPAASSGGTDESKGCAPKAGRTGTTFSETDRRRLHRKA